METTTFFADLLNIKRPWFVTRVLTNHAANKVDVYLDHEKNIQARCPVCEEFFSVYDHGPVERVFQHLDMCQLATYIHVRLPRVKCPRHGVRQIVSEFGAEGSGMTYSFERHVLDVAQVCDIQAAAGLCNVSWDRCWGLVERSVERGLERKPHRIPERIGVDEKSIAKGHVYETLVYDQERGTVEYVCDDRSQDSLEAYYQQFDEMDLAGVKSVSMDMWDPYIAATKACVPNGEKKIVFDRYHVMKYVVDAVDTVRKQEHRSLMDKGIETLKGTKYLWLTSEENLSEAAQEHFEPLRKKNLKVARAWAIKENIRFMWDYVYERCMRKFFAKWYQWATHCRLQPMVEAAATLKRHLDNIVTYAKHRVTNALGEGLNSQIEKIKRKACGFRNRSHYRIAIYFHCGGLDLYSHAPWQPSLRIRPITPQLVGVTH
jgi:transposase